MSARALILGLAAAAWACWSSREVLAEPAEPAKPGSTVAARRQHSDQAGMVRIHLRSRHSAIDLAAAELVRYLGQMAGRSEAAVIVPAARDGVPTIELGLFQDCGVALDGVRDASRDDAIHVDVRDSQGVIAGSNPRSVLFAAYRFLEACGCRWIRPGKDGDHVPARPVHDLTARLADKAAYRFRGNNNCGTYSLDQILDKIAWAPKVGLNTFFSEFLLPRFLYNGYYSRKYPSLREPEPRSDEEIRAYHELTVREIKRRGMWYHAAGHGWTGLVVGGPESESDHGSKLLVAPGKEHFLALVGGKRVNHGPTFTDLCYGNPEVQRILVRCVADYAASHPEVDYLHVWQDDSMNRTCECPLCRDTRVADWYLTILNQLDAELSRRKISTKIVFLIYQDLIWGPEKERFVNPDRFVMMYAPISRRYSAPYYVGTKDVQLPPYRLNHNDRPVDEETGAGFLRAWQRAFRGDSFVFDYHMTWHHYLDPGYYGFTEVMAEDICRLPKMGMDGFVSCQVLRSSYPHGFPMDLHARLLWNPSRKVDDVAREYFAGAFGDDGELARRYMAKLSDLFAPLYLDRDSLFGKDAAAKQTALSKLAQVPQAVADFRPVIARRLSAGAASQQQSWKYLSLHADLVLHLAAGLRAKAEGNAKQANEAWKQAIQQVAEQELETDPVLDIHWFTSTYQGRRLFAPAAPTRRSPPAAKR